MPALDYVLRGDAELEKLQAELRDRILGSTAHVYVWKGGAGQTMGELLTSDLFYFREDLHETDESILLERNLIEFMPIIVTHKSPAMKAAKVNIQMEFARTVESIRRGLAICGLAPDSRRLRSNWSRSGRSGTRRPTTRSPILRDSRTSGTWRFARPPGTAWWARAGSACWAG